jgi:hypothetical protein
MMLQAFLKHRLHNPLEGLVDGVITVPGLDATGQDPLDGSAVVFGATLGSRDTVAPS